MLLVYLQVMLIGFLWSGGYSDQASHYWVSLVTRVQAAYGRLYQDCLKRPVSSSYFINIIIMVKPPRFLMIASDLTSSSYVSDIARLLTDTDSGPECVKCC